MISRLDWQRGDPGVQLGGLDVLAVNWAHPPSWIPKPDVGRPGWDQMTPESGSTLIAELLEALPTGSWHVRVWWNRWDRRVRLSVMAWDARIEGWADHARICPPDWVDAGTLPLAVVMGVMES